MADILLILNSVTERFSNPEIKEKFKDTVKKIQFEFVDTKEHFILSIDKGSATISNGTVNLPDVSVSTTTDVLEGIINRKINPVMAYSTRKIKVKGSMEDLLKLQKLLM